MLFLLQLAYCVVQFLEKDSTLTEPVSLSPSSLSLGFFSNSLRLLKGLQSAQCRLTKLQRWACWPHNSLDQRTLAADILWLPETKLHSAVRVPPPRFYVVVGLHQRSSTWSLWPLGGPPKHYRGVHEIVSLDIFMHLIFLLFVHSYF